MPLNCGLARMQLHCLQETSFVQVMNDILYVSPMELAIISNYCTKSSLCLVFCTMWLRGMADKLKFKI